MSATKASKACLYMSEVPRNELGALARKCHLTEHASSSQFNSSQSQTEPCQILDSMYL